MNIRFKNAEEAFKKLYHQIILQGDNRGDSLAIFDYGFIIENPMDNEINIPERNWSKKYAEDEWQWYLSGDPSVDKLGQIHGKIPKIWDKMKDSYGYVRSNYGWQWLRENQLERIIDKLRDNNKTRQATISIYDGKEISYYDYDTPCTYAVTFTILNDRLNMSVLMRSNDLWYGFCNDQYCFSRLQQMVSKELNVEVGTYYHHATNLHLYNNFLNKEI